MSLSKKTRFEVFKRDSFICQYCGKSAPEVILHVDHIDPKANGGCDEMFNLITACFDCNMGKKAIRLDDHTEITKQKEELDKLNEKRQQLEMLMEYRKSLHENTLSEVDVLNQELSLHTGFTFSGSYEKKTASLIRKYGLPLCLECLVIGVNTYYNTGTQAEVIKLLDKLSGILYNVKLEEDDPEQFAQNAIRSKMRRDWGRICEWKCKEYIAILRDRKTEFAKLEKLVEMTDWDGFSTIMENIIAEMGEEK